MISVTVNQIEKPPTGEIKVRYANGITQHFPNVEAIRDYIGELETEDIAMRFAMARAVNVGNDLANTRVIEGKTIEIDMTANSPITIK